MARGSGGARARALRWGWKQCGVHSGPSHSLTTAQAVPSLCVDGAEVAQAAVDARDLAAALGLHQDLG